nr:MAG TPA: Recombination and repair protein [Caudoviricetes sp.]
MNWRHYIMAKKTDTLVEKVLENNDKLMVANPLLTALRENDKKNLFVTNVTTAFIKTGFHLYDYFFGSVINIHDQYGNIIRQEPRVGQAAGTFNMFVGASGSSKTTLAIQVASNILRQFENATIMHYDCEQRIDISRIEIVSQLPSYYFHGDTQRYILQAGAVGLDVIQEAIVKMYVNKMKMKKELIVDSGFKDEFNNPVMIFPPSIFIIDSITTVLSTTFSPDNTKEASDAEKMRGNTEGARDAKTLKGFFKDILPLCKEANIIIFAVNHLNSNMSMNAFMPVAKQQNFLKQEESIPGGKTMIFYPFNIAKMVAKPSDDFREDTDGFSGHMVMIEPIKSSSNQSGNNSKGVSFQMVFSYKHGFDPLRTLIMYGKEKGLIEGNKTRMKFRDDPSFTFSFKTIMKEKDEKPIWENLKKFVIPTLNEHLSFIEPNEVKFDQRSMDY